MRPLAISEPRTLEASSSPASMWLAPFLFTMPERLVGACGLGASNQEGFVSCHGLIGSYFGPEVPSGKFGIPRIRGEQILPNVAAFSDLQNTRFQSFGEGQRLRNLK